MSNSPLPGPSPRCHREHAVASQESISALRDRIPEDAGQLERLRGRHVLSARDFDAPLLLQLFRLAARLELCELPAFQPAVSRVLGNLYFDQARDPSRLSFNAAWLRLGGSLLNIERTLEELLGERVAQDEVAELCSTIGDITLLRTLDEESLSEIAELSRVPVINGGNGDDEDPTHAMADLYTLFKWRPELTQANVAPERRLNIGIFGDVGRTPTIRSLLLLLAKFPQSVGQVVTFSTSLLPGQREELAAAGLDIKTVEEVLPHSTEMNSYRKLLPELDLLYVHLYHPEQFNRLDFLEALEYFKPGCMVLSPVILNQEFSDQLNDSPYNGYFAQARGAVYLRMALLGSII